MYDKERKSYKNLCAECSNMFNEFSKKSILWIFGSSEEEVLNKMEEHGRSPENLTSIGMGGYVFSEDLHKMEKILQEIHNKKATFLKDFNNLCGAFLDGLWNYEIRISWDTTEVDIIEDLLKYNDMTLESLTNEERLALIDVRNYYNKEFDRCN